MKIVIDNTQAHELKFVNVSFGYENADVLHDINITLPAGNLTAFVGVSGAGKTTAAQLIPKYWEVGNGVIMIDSNPINSLKNESLMDNISFVFQETFMLNDNIYENIAIAMIKNAHILLLDKSTSSLDADNEKEINHAIDMLMKDWTVIMIAHRLNIIRNADNIIVLDEGKILEQGTHESLMEQAGWYSHVIEEQNKAKKWEYDN
jgi:ABC-type multidrug transport system, ATPase and permease components